MSRLKRIYNTAVDNIFYNASAPYITMLTILILATYGAIDIVIKLINVFL